MTCNKTLIVMGNGPSLKNVNFKSLKQYDTFGMNSAYKMYDKLNFYPTYFGCFDFTVCNHHKKHFSELVKSSPIKKFFFLEPKYFDKEIQEHEKFQKIKFINNNDININKTQTNFNNFINVGCSGANAVSVGIILGYTKIILIGCDANYINHVKGSKLVNGKLVITETPTKNPNYWFDNYQEKGDIYNVPNTNTWHIPAWKKIATYIKNRDIQVINCSSISKIDCFPKSTLDNELLYDKYVYFNEIDSRFNDIQKNDDSSIEKLMKICLDNTNAVAFNTHGWIKHAIDNNICLLYTSPSPRD